MILLLFGMHPGIKRYRISGFMLVTLTVSMRIKRVRLPCITHSFHFFRRLALAVVFLERLQIYPTLPMTHIEYIGTLYAVRTTSNAEIRFRFYELALLDPKAAPADAKVMAGEAANWVVGEDGTGVIKGRMKFCRPVFRAVYRADPIVAVDKFRAHKNGFHPIARKLIEKVSLARLL